MDALKAAAERLKALENGESAVTTGEESAGPEVPAVSVGARLRAARKQAGLSRAKVVKELDRRGARITSDAVRNHEREHNANVPRGNVKKAYAALYQKPESELFD